jgi:hypothetical protein
MRLKNQLPLLARAAGRAATRPEYLGWILARYAEVEAKSDEQVAEMLGASVQDLYRLRLCLRPRLESFAADVQQIAGKFELDAGDLARVIRHVEALEGMKEDREDGAASQVGLMMAARARRKKSGAHSSRKKNGPHSKS